MVHEFKATCFLWRKVISLPNSKEIKQFFYQHQVLSVTGFISNMHSGMEATN